MSYKKIENNQGNIKVFYKVEKEEFQKYQEKAFKDIISQAKRSKKPLVNGFQNSKLPFAVYLQHYGKESLVDEALNHCFQDKFSLLYDDLSIDIQGTPSVTDFEANKDDGSISFAFSFLGLPAVTFGEYKGLSVSKENFDVTNNDIEKSLKELVSKDIILEDKVTSSIIELGDTVIFDFEGILDNVPFEGGSAQNYSLEIGTNSFIPGFESQMIGLAKGEKKDITVTFPKEYQAPNLAGKEVVFKLQINEIKFKKLPDLNSDYIKSLNLEGVSTKEELYNHLRKKMLLEKSKSEHERVLTNLIDQVVNNASVNIPKEMIDHAKESLEQNVKDQAKQYGIEYEMFLSINGTDIESFNKVIELEAHKRVKTEIVLLALARHEKIIVTDEEIQSNYAQMAKSHNHSIEECKKEMLPRTLFERLLTNKVVDIILKNAKRI